MDKKPTKSTKIYLKQPYHMHTVLNINNKITYLVSGQQTPG